MLLSPLPYHVDVCAHLKRNEPGLWQWFMSDRFSDADEERSKLELLKSCYRMGPESHADVYRAAQAAADRLQIEYPITLYQAQSPGAAANAALYFFADELAVVLCGPVTELLDGPELVALFGHEFSHHRLFTDNNGEYFAASRLLHWCADQPDCHPAYIETARRFQLHIEIFADRGAALVCDAPDAAIASLVKVSTGLTSVAVDDYVEQAREILSKDPFGAEGITHPEVYLRVQALKSGLDNLQDYAGLVRGKLDSGRLDILDQRELATLTYHLAQSLGTDARFRADACTVYLRELYPSFKWGEVEQALEDLAQQISTSSELTHSYLAYVLLDIVCAERDDDYPLLGPMLHFARALGLYKVFDQTARKELKLKKVATDKRLENSRFGTEVDAPND